MSDTEVPKMQVHVATLKPWEAMLLVATGSESPMIATMDRRKDEFEITVGSEQIKIRGGGEFEEHDEEARQVRCPQCAKADFTWEADGSFANLLCAGCNHHLATADMEVLLGLVGGADALYEMSPDDWKLT